MRSGGKGTTEEKNSRGDRDPNTSIVKMKYKRLGDD